MGKNQAYKAMQRARLGSSSGAPGASDSPKTAWSVPFLTPQFTTDGSFHSPEWHAARLASLSKTHTVTWEEFKKKQKEEELKRGEMEADKDKMMREYRAQLDAERAQKLALGKKHSRSKSSSSKKERKDKEAKKRTKKRRKHRSSSESSSSSSSESSSSDDEDRGSKKSRSRSRSKRDKKDKKHRSSSKHIGSDSEEEGGPVRLSKFFGNTKN